MNKLNVVEITETMVVNGNGEIVEMATTSEETTKKVSLRQDFLKGFSTIADNKEVVCQSIGMEMTDFDKMVQYFNEQINKTKSVEKGAYKPTEKASLILDILIAFEGEFKTGKEIAEGSQGQLKANGVSGSIRGLVSNGFVEATMDSPKKYKITQIGIDFLNDEE